MNEPRKSLLTITVQFVNCSTSLLGPCSGIPPSLSSFRYHHTIISSPIAITIAVTVLLVIPMLPGPQQIWTYEGRQVSSPRFQNLRADYLSGRAISLSEDAVAILDRSAPKSIRVCDVSTGRPLADGMSAEVEHDCEVVRTCPNEHIY